MSGGFTWLDWLLVGAVLLGTTILGGRLAGKQHSIRDFFLGGRKLPWYAVSASIVATEISAVTYVSLPSVVYRTGGNLTYLQIGLIGSLCARLIVGYVLVPAYYAREIYSPYDFIGDRLGARTQRVATAVFSLGGVLGQAARVYLIAVVLEVVLHRELGWVREHWGIDPLVGAVAAIGLVAVGWTLLGGIATVVWTDAVLFGLFLLGIGITLVTLGQGIDGGWADAMASASEAGKLRLFDFDPSPAKAYTFWAAAIAATWGGVGSYGTDQLLTQRLFCCRNATEARKAIVGSYVAMAVTALVSLVGIGLFAYYAEHPLSGLAAELVAEKPDRIFPVFLVEVIPRGWKGLVVAGAFAAAISSLDSIMAALSQTSLSAVYLPRRRRLLHERGLDPDSPAEARRALRVSRGLVVVWAMALCSVAVGMDAVAERYGSILDLALAMAGYTGGALVAGFLLAFLPLRRDGSGYVWSAPLSVLCVFALVWHGPRAQLFVSIVLALALVGWLAVRVRPDPRAELGRTLAFVALLATILACSAAGFARAESGEVVVIAWPWYVPCGSVVALAFGWLLGRPRAAGDAV